MEQKGFLRDYLSDFIKLIMISNTRKEGEQFIIEKELNPNEVSIVPVQEIKSLETKQQRCKEDAVKLIGGNPLPFFTIERQYYFDLPDRYTSFMIVSFNHFPIRKDQIYLYAQKIDKMSEEELLFNLFLILEPIILEQHNRSAFRKSRFPRYDKLSAITIARQYEKITNCVISAGSYNEIFKNYKEAWYEWLKENDLIRWWEIENG